MVCRCLALRDLRQILYSMTSMIFGRVLPSTGTVFPHLSLNPLPFDGVPISGCGSRQNPVLNTKQDLEGWEECCALTSAFSVGGGTIT